MTDAILQPLVSPYHKHKQVKWTPEANVAYKAMIDAVIHCNKLYFYDDTLPLTLETDACNTGMGAYLYQTGKDGKQYPIQFISKAFNNVQKRWGTNEQEAYAIFYAFMELGYILRYYPFHLRTDHDNLKFITSNPAASAKVLRWKMAIQEYDFRITHIPGKDNIVADALSRIPVPDEETEDMAVLSAVLRAAIIPDEAMTHITKAHNTLAGHSGVKETLRKLDLMNLHWPKRRQHVKHFIGQCPICQKLSYKKDKIYTKRYTLSTSRPMERINVDTIGPLRKDIHGNSYILAIIDTFSRFLMLYAIPDLTGEEAARKLLSFIATFGCPTQMTSDQGSQFVNHIVKELMEFLGSDHVTSIAYSHEENAIVERSHRETMRNLRAQILDRSLEDRWSDCLPLAQRIHNAKLHETTGLSPSDILFGSAISLDHNIFVPEETRAIRDVNKELSTYMQNLLSDQKRLLEIARKQIAVRDAANLKARKNDSVTIYPVGSWVLYSGEGSITAKRDTIPK